MRDLPLLQKTSRPSRGPNHLPTEWELGIIASGKATGRERLRMCGAIRPSLLYASIAWRTTSLLNAIPATIESTTMLYCCQTHMICRNLTTSCGLQNRWESFQKLCVLSAVMHLALCGMKFMYSTGLAAQCRSQARN